MAAFESDSVWPDWLAAPVTEGGPTVDSEDEGWWSEPPAPASPATRPDPATAADDEVEDGDSDSDGDGESGEPAPAADMAPDPPLAGPPSPPPPDDWTAPAHAAIRPPSGGKYVALAAVLILVAAAVVVWQYSSLRTSSGIAAGSGAASATTATTAAFPAAWDARVAPIAAFVEQQRHLAYAHPVRVDFLADDVFGQQYEKTVQRSRADADRQAALYRLQGLIGPTFDLYHLEPRLLAGLVFGLYDPDTKRVIVRGDTMTPIVRVVLAHELTHALQDQHFDLARDFTSSGQQHGYRTTVEADAVSVEAAYEATMSTADQAAADDAKDTGSLSPAELKAYPPALYDFESFPYTIGPSFLEAVRAARGQAGVDEALANPPTQDAELLQPDRYLNPPAMVTLIPPGVGQNERLLQRADLGEFGLLEVLASHGPFAPAWFALESYSNDVGIAYTVDGTVCQRVAVSFIRPAGATQFVTAAATWTKAVPGAKVTRNGDTVQLEACDPGVAAPPPPTVSVLVRVAFRADGLRGLQSAVAKKQITASRADCVATRTAGSLNEAQIDLLDTNPPKSKTGFITTLADAAFRACR